jgi:hypothetical protein
MTDKEDLSVERRRRGRFYVADENYWEVTGNSYDTYGEAEEELRELYDPMAAEEAREAAEEARERNQAAPPCEQRGRGPMSIHRTERSLF